MDSISVDSELRPESIELLAASSPDQGETAPQQDVVDTALTEEAEQHQSQLVEGDFFPTGMTMIDRELEEGDEEDVSTAVTQQTVVSQTPPKPSPKKTAPMKRKRVSWADDNEMQHLGLVKHVTSFFMPHSSQFQAFRSGVTDLDPSSPLHAPTVSAPPQSIFKERENEDGSKFLFCKVQRPAQRFMEWKRQAHIPGATPFDPQRHAPPHKQTLFAALCHTKALNTSADVHVHAQLATRSTTFIPQMPFIRTDAAFDEPLVVPF